MKTKNKPPKIFTCKKCNKNSEVIGVVQKEENYYSLNLSTNQWEDFHGDESVESQNYFCLNCQAKINSKEIF